MSNAPDKTLNILITGGSGFLGKAIAAEFLNDQCPVRVGALRIFDICPSEGITDPRVTYIRGDICNKEEIVNACSGMDIVVHAAAIVDWGTKKPKEVYRTNYTGTEFVIEACKVNQVPLLIYTSSLDAVITGRPLVNVDERQPYPEKHLNMYCESKCKAEQLVLSVNSSKLKTVALRPSDVWGEGDPFHIPPLIEMAKRGFYVRIGDGSARNQHVYVRNMAWAHVLAAKAMIEQKDQVFGKTYFITDGPGANFFTFFDDIVIRSGYAIRPRNLWLPRGFTYFLGAMAEYAALIVRPFMYYVPKLSRFAVMYTTTEFSFTADRAKKDFGFYPKYSHEVAMENTVDYFRRRETVRS